MMKSKEKSTFRKIEFHRIETFYLIIRGIEVGIVSGLVSALYRFLLSKAESTSLSVIEAVKGSPGKTALWLAALVLIGFIVSKIVKYQPLSSSSGIPQITGEIRGYLDPVWWKIIIAKIIGGTMSIFGGLSLGREGPSIQLGGMAAKGVARITKADKTTELRMISCGGGAGLAAAFNAPLAGIMFTLEEIHKTIDASIICMGIVATITADYISKLFFGQDTVFSYTTGNVPLKSYWILILLGIILGVSGVCYNAIMLFGQKIISKIKTEYRMMLIFLISGVLGLFMPKVLGGGHTMATLLINEHPGITVLAVLLITKFLFSLLSFSSGAPGGIFFPLLILGTYQGAIFAEIAIKYFGLDPSLWQEIVVVSMAGFFASIVRAPLTGIILVFEMTGNLDSLLPLAAVSLTSYALANLMGSTPIYTSLLENILKSNEQKEAKVPKIGEKVLQTYVLPIGSPLIGKAIKDVDWGRHCLVVSIEREETSITPKGETVLCEGDTLVIMISQRRFSRDNERLEKIING